MNRRLLIASGVTAAMMGLSGTAAARQSMGSEPEEDPATTPAAPQDVRPPAPTDPGKPSVLVPYVITFVLIGGAVGLAVMPSGRTHQD